MQGPVGTLPCAHWAGWFCASITLHCREKGSGPNINEKTTCMGAGEMAHHAHRGSYPLGEERGSVLVKPLKLNIGTWHVCTDTCVAYEVVKGVCLVCGICQWPDTRMQSPVD